ncbi:SCO7613 C-terminal domain-containing membrane protein [Bifidobacterium cebidarum]|uniref:Uncharacterized protein n=1 Tax=Bifidobacterium cebidarum TaxID=2650773 RepID=A0A6I1GMC0_9BIFI|nr:hypothetical protein [Bifidobacterium cebidarum]KAB7789178.1 hypothetical protein F7D08_0130 [Bifidobacterium cebidarum]
MTQPTEHWDNQQPQTLSAQPVWQQRAQSAPQYSPFQPQPELAAQPQAHAQSFMQQSDPIPPVPAQPQLNPYAQPPQPNQPKHSSIQILLLILGVALVTIAVFAFASFAYGALGDIGRAVCIGVVGIAALVIGMLLTKRLRVTAEGLTWAGLAALSIDAVLISGIPPVASIIPDGYSSGVIVLGITALAYALRALAAHLPERGSSRSSAVSASSLPLRATTLYAMCALPFAFMSFISALPIPDTGVQWVLGFSVGALAAIAFAAMVRIPQQARYADFEWMASVIAAMLTLGIVSAFGYTTIDGADPLWLTAIASLIPPVLWAAILAILHRKPSIRTGKLLNPTHRIAPVLGFFWTLTIAVESLLRRGLSDAMSNDQAARTIADFAAIVIAGFALVCATLLMRHNAAISSQERIAAGAMGSWLLLILIAGDFTHGSPLPMVASMVGYIAMLAICIVFWIIAAQTTRFTSTSFAPSPFIPARSTQPHLESLRPRPYPPAPGPVFPQPQSPAQPIPQPHVSPTLQAMKLLTAAQIVVTCFTAVAGIVLLFLAWTDPQPYAPVDLIAMLSGAAALIVGIRWLQIRPTMRSWPALWPALTLLMVPSLLISCVEAPSLPRMLALFVIALCSLLIGAIMGLQAPLIYGTAVLVVHLLIVVWPWLAEFSRHYWWVWLLIGGIILIVAAARYEASLKSMRTIAARISDLR